MVTEKERSSLLKLVCRLVLRVGIPLVALATLFVVLLGDKPMIDRMGVLAFLGIMFAIIYATEAAVIFAGGLHRIELPGAFAYMRACSEPPDRGLRREG